MDAEQAAQPDLADLNSPSQTAIYTLWKNIVSRCYRTLESLWERKQDEYETILGRGSVGSVGWVIQKAKEFQYDSGTPQIMQLIDGEPAYPVVDESKRIVTYAVCRNNLGLAKILVAKDDPPTKLAAGELSALQDYFTSSGTSTTLGVGIGFAGQNLEVDSLDPDLLYLEATIWYYGQFANTIQAAVILAIENRIKDLSPEGYIYIQAVIDAIQEVEGVQDVRIVNMSARDAATPFGSGSDLVIAGSYNSIPSYATSAGYAIQETTAGSTFADKLTFNAI